MTITVKGLRFHAYHGLYAEEQKTGNDFEVNLTVDYTPPSEVIQSIEDTINYVSLYDIVRKAMQLPRHLLETLAMEIAEQIHTIFPMITAVELSIQKLHPPVENFTGNVGVIYRKEF